MQLLFVLKEGEMVCYRGVQFVFCESLRCYSCIIKQKASAHFVV